LPSQAFSIDEIDEAASGFDQKEKIFNQIFFVKVKNNFPSNGSSVVEHLLRHPKVKGLSLATTIGTEREKVVRIYRQRKNNKILAITKVVLIRLGIYVFVNKARGGGSPKFFIHTL
jgi:hypothetical protein